MNNSQNNATSQPFHLVLKIKHGEDTRRVTLHSIPSFHGFVTLIGNLFSINGFTTKYIDDDGDQVTITSDLELQEAVHVAIKNQNGVLRLSLHAGTNGLSNSTMNNSIDASKSSLASSQIKNEKPNDNNATSAAPQQQVPLANPFAAFYPVLGQLMANPQMMALIPQLLQGMSSMTNLNGSQMQGTQQGQPGNPTSAPNANPFANVNPMMLAQLLSNPFIMTLIQQIMQGFSQVTNQQANNNNASNTPNGSNPPQQQQAVPPVDLAALFSQLGLSSLQSNATSSTTPASTPLTGSNLNAIINPFQEIFQNMVNGIQQATAAPQATPNKESEEEINNRKNKRLSADRASHNRAYQATEQNKRNAPTPSSPQTTPNNNNATAPTIKSTVVTQAPARLLARFVGDVTVPDGTGMTPGQIFRKTWRMRNEGAGAWPSDCSLIFVGGDKMTMTESVQVPPVNPEEETEISVEMTAPSRPGRYIGYWRLACSDGTRFGHRVWVDIIVTPTSAPVTATPSVTAMSAPPAAQPVPMVAEPTIVSTVKTVTATSDTLATNNNNENNSNEQQQDSAEVVQLLSMGFTDKKVVKELLAKNNNDVLRTVQDLLAL